MSDEDKINEQRQNYSEIMRNNSYAILMGQKVSLPTKVF